MEKCIDKNVPGELKGYAQWVSWQGIPNKNGKIKKRPVDPKSGLSAKVNDPSTWATFKQALRCSNEKDLAGVGFVFTEQDQFIGIDLDYCRDPQTGTIEAEAKEIIDSIGSYTEISPSGTGVHIIAKGKLPFGPRHENQIEIYDQGRFFTVTGEILEDGPTAIRERSNEIERLYKSIFENETTKGNSQIVANGIKNFFGSASNNRFQRLLSGNFTDYPSQSEADLALCKYLAIFTDNNKKRIDESFRDSLLYRPKWDEIHTATGKTYGEKTIEIAMTPFSPQLERKAKPETQVPAFKLSDIGNAERLVHHVGSKIRYCHAWKKWLIWDGKRWTEDKSDQIRLLAKDVVRKIYIEAEKATDSGMRQSLAKHAIQSESEARIRAMISLARSEKGIPISPEELDQDSWLLNCLNGTIDLRTGSLIPHDRNHFITRMVPVEYLENADCPRWLSFLDEIMARNENLISFLQRAIGYSLTGETSEQCLFIFFGSGANGKSTFLQTISFMLGDYSMQTPTDTLLVKRNGAIPNDVARLKGARFVTASEAEYEQRFAEGLIKQMTGGDTISARFLHQEYFDFVPTHKIFLGTNHKPVIKGVDEAIWRRIRLVPFEVYIPEAERDLNLLDKLKDELSGILSWAVKGCLQWQQEGLEMPQEVRSATNSYRSEMDFMTEFLNEKCNLNPEGKILSKELYAVYADWCDANGEKSISIQEFGSRLREKGFTQVKIGPRRARGWSGLELLGQSDVH